MNRFRVVLMTAVAVGSMISASWAQTGYKQTNLVANLAGVANHTDAQLSNSWGVAFIPGAPFWIADNNSGVSTLYDAQGNKQALVVTIPTASVQPCSPGCPTGIVANNSGNFGGAGFIFDTEDGILAAWTGANSANKVVDNSAASAVYKGLATVSNSGGTFLLAANFRSSKIDVFDTAFHATSLAGSFTDPNLPAGFAPHGIHIVNGQVFVTYAMQDAPKHDPMIGPGLGIVDVFDMNGNFVKRFASSGALNAPWGVALAPASFGSFANAILVGNFGDGTINAFDATSGKMLGQLTDPGNHPLVNPGLWELIFGEPGTGDPNTLYLTAGGSDQTHGLFATVVPAQTVTTGDFSLALSAQSATIARGGSANITIDASPVAGFQNSIALSCSAPTGISCSFSPSSIMPGASSNMTITVSSGYSTMAMMLILPFGLAGLLLSGGMRSRLWASSTMSTIALGAVLLTALIAVGCSGGNGSRQMMNASSSATVMVTGTSGAVMHSVPVMINIH